MSGLQTGQLAKGQANKKICSVPKTGASKDAVTSGHACPATEAHLLAGRAGGQWELEQIARASSCFSDLGVMMVTDGERTCQDLDRISLPSSTLLYPTCPSELPASGLHQSGVLVEMVLFLPSTFGVTSAWAFCALTYLC